MSAKAYKGMSMEGPIATWYAANARKSSDFVEIAAKINAWIPQGAQVLELAPGPGYLSIELARLGKAQVTGLDISRTFVELAQTAARKAGVRVDFRLGDAANIPYPQGSFDFVYCSAAFKNFSQPVRALAEMHRVLKPGGKALIHDLRRDATAKDIDDEVAGMQMNWINAFFTRLAFSTLLLKRAYSQAQMEAMLAQANLPQAKVNTDRIGLEVWIYKA